MELLEWEDSQHFSSNFGKLSTIIYLLFFYSFFFLLLISFPEERCNTPGPINYALLAWPCLLLGLRCVQVKNESRRGGCSWQGWHPWRWKNESEFYSPSTTHSKEVAMKYISDHLCFSFLPSQANFFFFFFFKPPDNKSLRWDSPIILIPL